jgi:hypothetical protein
VSSIVTTHSQRLLDDTPARCRAAAFFLGRIADLAGVVLGAVTGVTGDDSYDVAVSAAGSVATFSSAPQPLSST